MAAKFKLKWQFSPFIYVIHLHFPRFLFCPFQFETVDLLHVGMFCKNYFFPQKVSMYLSYFHAKSFGFTYKILSKLKIDLVFSNTSTSYVFGSSDNPIFYYGDLAEYLFPIIVHSRYRYYIKWKIQKLDLCPFVGNPAH